MRTGRLVRLMIGAALVGIGCTGSIDGGKSTGPGDPPDDGKPPVKMDPVKPPAPPKPGEVPNLAGAMPLRRLTIFEYNNTIRDLLGDGSSPASNGALAVDLPTAVGFVSGAKVVTSVDARQFLDLSVKIGEAVAAKLTTLLPPNCGAPAASAEEGCAKQFIKTFGLRAYRRPLVAAEEADLFKLYMAQKAPAIGAPYLEAIRIVIAGILQSPYFLYRWELGTAPQMDGNLLVKFNSYEIASRLSYFFWATMPDTALFDAAGRNELQNPDRIAMEARRLMGDNKFKDGLRDFSLQWLAVSGLPTMEKDGTFEKYTAAVGQAMLDETTNFFSSLLFGKDATGKLDSLFTSNVSTVSGPLAKLYGMSNATGDDARQVTLPAGERAGILTQGAFLAAHADADYSHPVKRGVHTLHNVLCIDIPGPDNVEVPPLEERKAGQTTRKRYEEAIAGKAICASCHDRINPVGFAFEQYDAVGQFRTMEDGQPVDASSVLSLTSGEIRFKNGVEFVKQLPSLPEVRDCMSRQWLRYVMRRKEVKDEEGSFKDALDAFTKSGFDLRELLVATTKTRAFTHRQPQPGEGQ
jgi:hypothetical protein